MWRGGKPLIGKDHFFSNAREGRGDEGFHPPQVLQATAILARKSVKMSYNYLKNLTL
jgi:hypothetical protein